MSLFTADVSTIDRSSAVSDIRAGVASMVPLVVGYVPFALVVGTVLAAHGGLVVGVVGTWTIFGGSAHLATVRAAGSGAAVAIVTGLLVNARLVVYSASLARHWRHQPWWFRIVAAAFVIDPTWAAGERLAVEGLDPRSQRRRFLAAGITLGTGFSATVVVGMVLGARLDASDLTIAVPLCLLALIGPALRASTNVRVVSVGAGVALLTSSLPSGAGLLAAIAAGCAAGSVGTGATTTGGEQ